MSKAKLNFYIDTLFFVCLTLLISTGFLLRYTLPAGSGRISGGGQGRSAMNKTITLLWGLDKHQWGDIHFWIAVFLMLLLLAHLYLHWRWIVCMVKGQDCEASGFRALLGIAAAVGLLLTAFSPLMSTTVEMKRSEILEQTSPTATSLSEGIEEHEVSIRGNMTLIEIAELAEMPVEDLIRELGLPKDTPIASRIGRLRRQYSFTMSDVRRVIEENRHR